LAGTRFGDVRWLAETGSTNADVLELAAQGEAEGVVLVADHQLAGRGRRGRTWEAPPEASLLWTVLLRPPSSVAALTTMATALAVTEALATRFDLDVRLKWPNDLVWSGDSAGSDRKLAGILAEAAWPAGSSIASGWSEPRGSQRAVVAVGVGLNVNWGTTMPEHLRSGAVSLDELLDGRTVDREDLLVAILTALERTYALLLQGSEGADVVRSRWRARSATLGRRVRVDLGAEDVVGEAVDVSAEGHLVVRTLEGDRRTLAVGDVVHLRPL